MRTRLIRPEFFRSEELGSLGHAAKLLFAGLWCAADRDGRLRNRPRVIAADVFPTHDDVTSEMVEEWLRDLDAIGAILLYEVDGKAYVQISNFAKYQKIHPKEAPSTIPPPEGSNRVAARVSPKVRPRARRGSGSGATEGSPESDSRVEPEARRGRLLDRVTSSSTSYLPSGVPSSRKRDDGERPSTAVDLGFNRFWAAYPNRTHKVDAERAWRRLRPDAATVEAIVSAIGVWKTHRQWADPQFIPHPATWLRRRLWEDDFVLRPSDAPGRPGRATTASDALRILHDDLKRRAESGDEQARIAFAEFMRDHAAKFSVDPDSDEPQAAAGAHP